MNYTDNANIFKALGDENRLKILELLLEGEKCGSELLEKFSMGQSTLSHHLKLMCVSGIIKSRKVKTATYYSINPDGAKNAVNILASITGIENEISSEKAPCEEEEKKPSVRQTGSRPNGWLL
ncbi:MAG: winged helix-turn-helix transcriptional regulator [Clostridia bacterium]|nr:winged helix-turn-helix transcriptional regulator [Clostridia bacterium]